MKNTIFTGSCVALVTPFTGNGLGGGVNYAVLGELIERQIALGTSAILVCGTTGEPATMSDDEKAAVIEFTVKNVGRRVPVIAGTGTNSTAHSIELTKTAVELGVDGVLLVTPYYNKTSQSGMIAHFTAIADSAKIPCILYNVPARTGLNLLPETLKTLTRHENIVGIKEASGNISQIAEVARLCGQNTDIYSGNDDQIVPIMSLGGSGVISVLANIMPKQVAQMCEKWLNGDVSGALGDQLFLNPVSDAMFCDVNPIPVKTALSLMGFDVGPLRLPLCAPSEKNCEYIKTMLKNYGLVSHD